MANERQLKLKTDVVVTTKEREYQETIGELVRDQDTVLEIGCRTGATSALISSKSKQVIGTHHVKSIINRAREKYPQVRFEVLDGFSAPAALELVGGPPDVVYLNTSQIFGYDSLLDVICLLNMYRTVLKPRVIVAKSKALKAFVARCFAWDPSAEGIERARKSQAWHGTKFIGARGVEEFRATIPVWVDEDDVVLEIGCEWGTTTRLIAPSSRSVIGTDISSKCIEKAKRLHPSITFSVLDGFDVLSALHLGEDFSKVYIDISGLSGYRSLLDVISLLTAYETVLGPDAIVIKSGSLKRFAEKYITWSSLRSRG